METVQTHTNPSELLSNTMTRVATSRGTPPALRDEIFALAKEELVAEHGTRVPVDESVIGEALARAEAAWGRRLRNALYAFDACG